MKLPVDEPGTHRMFVNTMQGLLYAVSLLDDATRRVGLRAAQPDRGGRR